MTSHLTRGIFLILAIFTSCHTFAQETEKDFEQLWFRGDVRYIFNPAWSGKTHLDIQSTYDAGERWRQSNLTQEIRYQVDPGFQIRGAGRFFYANLDDTVNRYEIRPVLGFLFDIVNRGRFRLNNYTRFEWRQFFYNYSELNKSSGRLRNRTELRISINRDRIFLNKNYRIFLSWESFVVQDRELLDRFANRHRFRAGLEYKLDDHWRFSLSYYRQLSRKQIESEFNTTEDILGLVVIYQILKNP